MHFESYFQDGTPGHWRWNVSCRKGLRRLKQKNNARDVFATEKKLVQATEKSKWWTEEQNKIRSRLYKEHFAGTRPSHCHVRHFLDRLRNWRMWCATLVQQNMTFFNGPVISAECTAPLGLLCCPYMTFNTVLITLHYVLRCTGSL
jgi:hypothetical protein